MKVVFTGGGTGGHFYPIIAVAEEIRAQSRDRRLLMPQLYYLAPSAFDQEALFENEIAFEAGLSDHTQIGYLNSIFDDTINNDDDRWILLAKDVSYTEDNTIGIVRVPLSAGHVRGL